jgi:hypothetical protein
MEPVMTSRERRAARELTEYLSRLFGAEATISVDALPSRPQHPDRVEIEATVVTPPQPTPDPDAPRRRRAAVRDAHLVTEIGERYVSIRSSRYALNGGLVPVTDGEVTEGLVTDFGSLFPAGTIEVGVAWMELARAAAEILAGHHVLDGVVTSQVKSKFAEMRWYTSALPEGSETEVNAILDAASLFSSVVCESCGAPGVLQKGGWMRILCPSCAAERKKR